MKWFFGLHHVGIPGYAALEKGLQTWGFECIWGRVCVCPRWSDIVEVRGEHISRPFFFTMRVPASAAAVSCLCPLVVFLCVVSQSCCGTRVNLSPHTNPNLYRNQRLISVPEPTPIPSKSPDKHKTALMPSQPLSSAKYVWSKFQLKPRLDTMFYLTDTHMPNTPNLPSAISQDASSSNTRLKHGSDSKQGLPYKSTSQQVARHTLNNPKQASNINSKTIPKPRLGSLFQPKAGPNSKVVTGPKTNPESVPSTKLSSLFSPNQRSNTSDRMSPSTSYNASPASLSNPKSNSKVRPSSQTNTNAKSDAKIPPSISRTTTRAQRNQTKLLDTDKDSQHRPKRGWIWNQFFVLEEQIGPEPQYVGKVRYLYFSTLQLVDPFSLCPFFLFWTCLEQRTTHLLALIYYHFISNYLIINQVIFLNFLSLLVYPLLKPFLMWDCILGTCSDFSIQLSIIIFYFSAESEVFPYWCPFLNSV